MCDHLHTIQAARIVKNAGFHTFHSSREKIWVEFCFHLHVIDPDVCDVRNYKEAPLWCSLSMIEC